MGKNLLHPRTCFINVVLTGTTELGDFFGMVSHWCRLWTEELGNFSTVNETRRQKQRAKAQYANDRSDPQLTTLVHQTFLNANMPFGIPFVFKSKSAY